MIKIAVGFIAGIAVTAVFFIFDGNSTPVVEDVEKSITHVSTSIIEATEITCTYPQVLQASYQGEKVSHSLPKAETNPMIFTFTYDGEKGKLKYIDSTRTISETPLIKISDKNDELVFVEGNGNYLATHTIFKKDGVSLYSKETSLLGIPVGSLAMGTCVGY